jgi:hypothetical protein
MEFILLRLIQLSKRELRVLNDLFLCMNCESDHWSGVDTGEADKERLLINELIQIERDKREEYSALSRKIDDRECFFDEEYVLKKLTEFNLTRQNQLIEKLGDELLSIVKKISAVNTQFQTIVDENMSKEVETISLAQVLPYLPSQLSSKNSRIEVATPPLSLHSN